MRRKAEARRKLKPERRPRAKAAAKPTPDPVDDGKRDPATGRFLPGHRFWRTRVSSGPQPLFADADALWAACDAYFCWVEDNPLHEVQLVTFRGAASEYPVAKMRAMTKRGLCLYLGIQRTTWNDWKKDRPDLLPAIERAEAVIYTWKFEGAAANLLNANLVARELGLADKAELMGRDGGPIQYQDLEPKLPPKHVCQGWGGKFLTQSPAAKSRDDC